MGRIVVDDDATDHPSEALGRRPLPVTAGKAGRAPGALESLVETTSDDEWSVLSVGGLPGGVNPVMCDMPLPGRGSDHLPRFFRREGLPLSQSILFLFCTKLN